MAFLDGVKDKISKAGYTTMQKAKEMSDINKLNMAISESETKINEIYSEIGYKIYCAYREEPLKEVKEEVEQIRELEEAIEACKLQIQRINALNTCPRCGAKIKSEMMFCSNCGLKLQKELLKEEECKKERPAFCSECGAPLDAETKFCTVCGHKIEEQ